MQIDRRALSRRDVLIGVLALATTAASGRQTTAQTPAASPDAAEGFPERIAPLLAMTPAEVTAGALMPLTYADLTTQLDSVGLPAPIGDDLPEGFLAGTQALPLSHKAFQFALTPAWSDTFGFWPLEIDRMLVAGEPPNAIAIFAGIDTERVREALEASGYQTILQETGGDYYSFGDDMSPATEVGRLGVGSMNQAVVRDGTAIFTRDEGMIQHVTQVMAGLAPSVLESGGWPDLMATLAGDTVGVIAAAPAAFARSGDASAILQATFSVRAGAMDPDSDAARSPATAITELPDTSTRVQVRIRYEDAATAATEAEAIPERWASMATAGTGEPFTNLMLVESAGVASGDPTVAAVDFRVQGAAGRWHQMLYRGDLGPFVPQG